MVIPVVFLLLVVVSPTAAIINTDGEPSFVIQNSPDFNTDFGGIDGGGDGNLGLGILAAPLIGLALLAAIAGRSGTGTTVVPGATVIASPVPVPTPCPACPTPPMCPPPCNPTPACPPNYERLSVPAGTVGVAAGTVLQSCYRIITTAPGTVNYRGAAQLCTVDNATPVEFNTAGEFAAVSTRIMNLGTVGTLFTGHTDAFNGNTIVGINSGLVAVGAAFGAGAVGVNDCGTLAVGVAGNVVCAMMQQGVVCEVRLDGTACYCPPGTG